MGRGVGAIRGQHPPSASLMNRGVGGGPVLDRKGFVCGEPTPVALQVLVWAVWLAACLRCVAVTLVRDSKVAIAHLFATRAESVIWAQQEVLPDWREGCNWRDLW